MTDANGPRRRPANTFTTKNGNSIKLNRSFSDRRQARKDAIARARAARLSSLPPERWKRVLYSLHPKRVWKYWFSREGGIMALKLAGVGIIVVFLLLVGLFAYFRKDLPNITDVSGNNLPGSITYYDRTGQTVLWQDYDAVKRQPVLDKDINNYIKQATVAIEDKDFYTEGAFNVRGIARAAYQNAFGNGETIQGGSTITQQLVKLNENWTNDRSIGRKIKEIILAVELERQYSKQDILAGYLNIAPYGGIQYGVEAAAKDYFGTTAKDLTLAQASMLAAMPQAPSIYSPYSEYFERDSLIGRQHYILDKMVEQGMITRDKAEDAKDVDVLAQVKPLEPKYANIKAPYFVLAAKKELESRYGAETIQRGGWKVTTSLNLELQADAEAAVAANQRNVERNRGNQQAFAATDVKTGQMVALVGGADFNNKEYGQLNFAQTMLPPGSSFKPYDYAALINYSQNVGAGSVLYDQQGPLPGYPCTVKRKSKDEPGNCLQNYDFKYPGAVTLRYALGGSRNVPAVKAMLSVGVDKTVKMASDLMGRQDAYLCFKPGVDVNAAKKEDRRDCFGSSAIGDGAYLHLDDHANGLASLSRMGTALPKTYIMKIQDATGKTIDEWKKGKGKQVIKPDAAYIVNDMAADPRASYLPGNNKFHNYKGWRFAVKTGTTNDNYDGLMAAWSSQYAAITWVGHHTRNVELRGSMENLTSPVTRTWMQKAHDRLGTQPVDWTKPAGLKTASAFIVRNHIGIGSIEPSPTQDLFPSWYEQKSGNTSATVDKVSKKLATNCTPPQAKMWIGNSNANSYSVDQYVGNGRNNAGSSSSGYNTVSNDDVHNCNDQKPNVSLTVARNGQPTTSCDESGCSVTITVTQGTHPLAGGTAGGGTVKLNVNNNTVQTFTMNGSGPQTFTYNFTPNANGTANINAQVLDSVLYDATANGTVTTTTGGGGNPEPEEDEDEGGLTDGPF